MAKAHISRRDSTADLVELPMCRHDIDDYLGLTIETVSRSFTELESNETSSCRVHDGSFLRSHASLQRLNAWGVGRVVRLVRL